MHRHGLPFVASTYRGRREESDRRHGQHDWEESLDRIYRVLSSGDTGSGLAEMDRLLAADDHRLESYELLFERVREWQLADVTMALGEAFVERLVDAGRVHRALEVTEICLRRDPRFRPSADAVDAVVAHAREVGHESTAAMLGAPADGA